jgi:hypothetical protein
MIAFGVTKASVETPDRVVGDWRSSRVADGRQRDRPALVEVQPLGVHDIHWLEHFLATVGSSRGFEGVAARPIHSHNWGLAIFARRGRTPE